MCMYIYNVYIYLNKVITFGVIMLPPKVVDHLIKNLVPDRENTPSSCDQESPRDS